MRQTAYTRHFVPECSQRAAVMLGKLRRPRSWRLAHCSDGARRSVARLALAALVLLTTLAGVVIAITPASASTRATWTVQPGSFPTLGTLYDISCPSALECIAVGYNNNTYYDAITTDGGSHWITQGSRDQFGSFPLSVYYTGVSCANTKDCVIVGYSVHTAPLGYSDYSGLIYATTNGGATWTNQSVPSSASVGNSGSLAGVSCSTRESVKVPWRNYMTGASCGSGAAAGGF